MFIENILVRQVLVCPAI